MLIDQTIKNLMKLCSFPRWNESHEKAYKTGIAFGIKQGLEMARQKENNRKRLSYKKKSCKEVG